MRVIEPARYHPVTHRRRRWPLIITPVVLLMIAGTVNYARPLPTPIATVHVTLPSVTATPSIDWPDQGQAAVAASGYGLLGTHGDNAPIATVSIAKVIVALCVLQKQPLELGQTGPTYTVNAKDVADYERYTSLDGSLAPVKLGEKLTEYQALQALMIPSANNISDSLVRWVFGSQDAYKAYAADYLQQHSLSQTRIGADASGYDPGTTSTATDVTNLGLLALKSPVLMHVAGQKSAVLPVAGTVNNYNTVLGEHGITGLKTGNSDADPGAFVFTGTVQVGDTEVLTTGAVMNAPDLETALQDSTALAASLEQGFEQVSVVKAGASVGTLRAAWGASATIVPDSPIGLVRWKATPLAQASTVDVSKRAGKVGSLSISAGRIKSGAALKLKQPLAGPSFWWRLTRH